MLKIDRKRRVVGQYVAVTSLINYIAENHEEIVAAVEYENLFKRVQVVYL